MRQGKFSLTDEQAEFVNHFAVLGYRDKSSLVRAAIERLRGESMQRQLRESAELYAEVYAEDEPLQELTEQAIEDWPE